MTRKFPHYLSAQASLGIGDWSGQSQASVSRSGWWARFLATIAAIAAFGLLGLVQNRDESDNRLDRLLESAHCPAPDAPLEKFVLSIGTQADGGAPTLTCVYVKSDLGIRPTLRYAKPVYASNDRPITNHESRH